MISASQLQEWKSLPATQENAELLGVFVHECWETQDLEAYWEMSLCLSDMYSSLQDIQTAMTVLEEAYSRNVTEDQKKILTLLDKQIGLLLKTEDFDKLQLLLQTRARYAKGNPHQEAMQQFYLSVSLEGLKQDESALQALLSIPDNMSSSNQVSKYLKCSMLSLKLSQIGEARHYYEKALLFDSGRKNPIFHLVLSDMAVATGRYSEAMEEFELYFLKSKIKNRYLDRYLILCEKTDRLEEGKAFYELHRDSMLASTSKSSRQAFLEASLILFERMRDKDQISQIRRYLSDSNQRSDTPEIAFFDVIHALSSRLANLHSFSDRRDLFLRMSRILAEYVQLKRLYFMIHDAKGVYGYVYSKNLLIERHIEDKEVMNSVFSCIASATTEPKLLFVSDPLLKEEEQGGILVSLPSLDMPSVSMLATFSNAEKYERVHKLLYTFINSLQGRLLDLDERLEQWTMSKQNAIVEDTYSIGSLLIEGNRASKFNHTAKLWFEPTKDACDVEEILSCFTPRLFVDDFLNQKPRTVDFTKNSQRFSIELTPKVVGNAIFLMMKKAASSDILLEKKLLPSFEEVIDSASSNYSLMLFRLTTPLHEVFSQGQALMDLINAQFVEVDRISGGKVLASKVLSFGSQLICFETSDKRILSRIHRDVIENTSLLTKESLFLDFRTTCVVMTKKTTAKTLIDDLIRHNAHQVESFSFVERASLHANRLSMDWIDDSSKTRFSTMSWSIANVIEVQNHKVFESVLLLDCPPHLDEVAFANALRDTHHSSELDDLAVKKMIHFLSKDNTSNWIWNVLSNPIHFLNQFDSVYKKLVKSNSIGRVKFVFSLNQAKPKDLFESLSKYPELQVGCRDFLGLTIYEMSDIPVMATLFVNQEWLNIPFQETFHKNQLIYVHSGETLRKSTLQQSQIYAYYSVKTDKTPLLDAS